MRPAYGSCSCRASPRGRATSTRSSRAQAMRGRSRRTRARCSAAVRLGAAEQFADFVTRAHAAGLGVILDWVPAHFPNDAHGLIAFDGTPLYEHADPREGFHQDWNTMIYNLGRNEVSAFLIASALAWLLRYHVDGLRVDAV